MDEDEALGETVGAAGVAVPLAAAGGLAEAEPAGGAVAGAEEAVGVDERLNEDGLVMVPSEPVGGEAAGGEGKETGGQKADLDPGQSRHKMLMLRVLWGRG